MDYRIEQTASNEYTLHTGLNLRTPYMFTRRNLTSKRWEVFGGYDVNGEKRLARCGRKQDAIDYMIACWEDYKIQQEEQTKEDTAKCEKPYKVLPANSEHKHLEAEFSELIDAENWARECKRNCKDDFFIYYRSSRKEMLWEQHRAAQRRVDHFPEIVAKSGKDLKEMPHLKQLFLCKRTATLWQLESIINEHLILVKVGGQKLTNTVSLKGLVDGFIPVKGSVDATDISPECYAGYREIMYQAKIKKLSNPDIRSNSSFPRMMGAAMAKAHLEKGGRGLIELGE